MSSHSYSQPRRGFVSQSESAMTDSARVPRSTFRSRKTRKGSYDASLLYPFHVHEVLPGDHIRLDVHVFLRMATPTFPVLDDAILETFFFFVPARLCWPGTGAGSWKKFMGEQNSPADSIAYTVPQVTGTASGDPVGGLFDHLGVPTVGQVNGGSSFSTNALIPRGYMLICHEWFRDENLQNSLLPPLGDGPDLAANYNPSGNVNGLMVANRKHNFLSSVLPWPQKFTAPLVPLAGNAWVRGLGIDTLVVSGATSPAYESPNVTTAWAASKPAYAVQDGVTGFPQVYADLSTASGVAINTLRTAFMVQALLERDARGGSRYTEVLKMHFDVTSPDARLQRPEYLGGGSSSLNISSIAQTAPTTGVPLGAIGGAGTIVGRHGCSVAAVEHGYLYGLMVIRTEQSYSQRLDPMFKRSTRYDFAWPSLVEMGEQTVYSREIFANATAADNDVFGYNPRYEEYRTLLSDCVGLMRTSAAGNLAAWHFGEHFSARPTLGASYIRDPSRTVLQRVQSAGASAVGQQFIGEFLIDASMTRPLPAVAVPARLGRF